MNDPNTLAELQALSLSRPVTERDALMVAAWYERKAVVLDHLAAQGSRTAAVQAEAARRHAAGVEGVAA